MTSNATHSAPPLDPDPTQPTRTVEVGMTIRASAEEVFSMFADVERVKEWWGPSGVSCPFAKHNFKVGGTYLYQMRSDADGKEIWATGLFEEVINERRIVMTCLPSNPQGELLRSLGKDVDGPFAEGTRVGRIIVTLRESEGGETALKLRHHGLPESMHDSCVVGWTEAMDQLKRAVEKQ